MSACSSLPPASAPPQLRHTPGAYVEIAAGHFKADDFQFDYPSSWRLIKPGAADADGIKITLRAPGGGELSMRVVDEKNDLDAVFIPLAKGNFLMATVNASTDASDNLAAEIEAIVRSVRS